MLSSCFPAGMVLCLQPKIAGHSMFSRELRLSVMWLMKQTIAGQLLKQEQPAVP